MSEFGSDICAKWPEALSRFGQDFCQILCRTFSQTFCRDYSVRLPILSEFPFVRITNSDICSEWPEALPDDVKRIVGISAPQFLPSWQMVTRFQRNTMCVYSETFVISTRQDKQEVVYITEKFIKLKIKCDRSTVAID